MSTNHNILKSVLSMLVAGLAAASANAATIVVTPSNLGDWALYSTDSAGTVNTGTATADFVNGPATPPIGVGSAHLQTGAGAGNGSAQLRNDAFAGTRLDALTGLSYSTYITTSNGSQAPYLTLWLDTDNDSIRDDRLWFEPVYSETDAGNGNPSPQADVMTGVWQTWNVLDGMVYDDGPLAGPGSNAISFSAYLAAKPNATIVNDAGQNIGGIRITSGFASASDNFNTNVDGFTIATAAGSTTYDFEAVPEPTTIALVGVAGASLGLLVTRRRRRR